MGISEAVKFRLRSRATAEGGKGGEAALSVRNLPAERLHPTGSYTAIREGI